MKQGEDDEIQTRNHRTWRIPHVARIQRSNLVIRRSGRRRHPNPKCVHHDPTFYLLAYIADMVDEILDECTHLWSNAAGTSTFVIFSLPHSNQQFSSPSVFSLISSYISADV